MKKLLSIFLLTFITLNVFSQAPLNALPATVNINTISKMDAKFLMQKMNGFMMEEPDSLNMACYNLQISLRTFMDSNLQSQNFTNIPPVFSRYLIRRVFSNNLVTHRTGRNSSSTMNQQMIDRMIQERDKTALQESCEKVIHCRLLNLMNRPCPYTN